MIVYIEVYKEKETIQLRSLSRFEFIIALACTRRDVCTIVRDDFNLTIGFLGSDFTKTDKQFICYKLKHCDIGHASLGVLQEEINKEITDNKFVRIATHETMINFLPQTILGLFSFAFTFVSLNVLHPAYSNGILFGKDLITDTLSFLTTSIFVFLVLNLIVELFNFIFDNAEKRVNKMKR